MNDPVSVIIPTLRKSHAFSCFEKLNHIPWNYKLHVITGGKSWAQAINMGIAQADKKNDVIIMDDDVFISEKTFSQVEWHYDNADIFGFKLLFPTGKIQHAGGILKEGMIGHIGFLQDDNGQFDRPRYVCHATTSLVYIKRHVLEVLSGMSEDIPGIQMEDVDFSFRAIKAGFKILYLPGSAVHMQSASKRFIEGFDEKVGFAYAEIQKRHLSDPEFLNKVQLYPQPLMELIQK